MIFIFLFIFSCFFFRVFTRTKKNIPSVRTKKFCSIFSSSKMSSESRLEVWFSRKLDRTVSRVYAFHISHSYFSHISQTYLRRLGNLRDFLNFPFKSHQKRPITVNLNGKFDISRKFAARAPAGLRNINSNYYSKSTNLFALDKIAYQEERRCRQQTRGEERKAS